MLAKLSKHRDLGLLFIRLALGVVFLVHGSQKVFGGLAGTGQYLDSLGVPAAGFFGVVVAFVELLGGISFLLGILTRYFGILIAIDMLFALVLQHLPNGFSLQNGGFEYVFTLGLVAFALVFLGSGKYSLDYSMRKKEV